MRVKPHREDVYCVRAKPGDNRGMSSPARPLPLRRLFAYLIDSLVIFAWIAGLTAIGMSWGTELFDRLDPASTKIFGHAFSFTALTLPVVLYFALTERSAMRASPGKRALGLCVAGPDGTGIALSRALVRNVLKFLPWEVAHTAIWHAPGQPFIDLPTASFMALHAGALALAGLYIASLFVGSGRTPYERLSGTRVIARSA